MNTQKYLIVIDCCTNEVLETILIEDVDEYSAYRDLEIDECVDTQAIVFCSTHSSVCNTLGSKAYESAC